MTHLDDVRAALDTLVSHRLITAAEYLEVGRRVAVVTEDNGRDGGPGTGGALDG
jgi:hypothetical protein